MPLDLYGAAGNTFRNMFPRKGVPVVSEKQATRKLLVEYYAAMESNDPLRYSTYYADEMTLTFGNSPTITGRENIAVAMAEVLSRVRSLHHDLVNVWEQADGVVVYR